MFNQRIAGMPERCLNRICKAKFTRASHLGYKMKSETEVFAVMRCIKCSDTFLVSQMIHSAADYKTKLPLEDKPVLEKITNEEIASARTFLDTPSPFKTLMKGHKPGAPNQIENE